MYSPYRHLGTLLLRQRPVQFTLFLTRRCNAHCPYCFYLQSEDSLNNDDDELSLDEIRGFAPGLGKLLWLAFSGGEIFLRKDLVAISRTFYQYNQPVIMLFPTNGSMPERIHDWMAQIAESCPKSTLVVKLSIDDLGEAHDRLRDTPHSFDRTLETYQRLAELQNQFPNLELGVNTVFCAANQERMNQIIDFVRTLSAVHTHTISLVRGNLLQQHYQRVDMNKYLAAAKRLTEDMTGETSRYYRFHGARLKAAQDIVQRQLIHSTMLHGGRQIPCHAGRVNLVMEPNGEVYPCEILRRSLGNIRQNDYDIGKLLGAKAAVSGIQEVARGSCFCTHECHMMTNILSNWRMYPRVLRQYLIPRHKPTQAASDGACVR